MGTLGSISLGRIGLGSVSLGRIGGLSKNGGDAQLFKQILSKLKKEQPQLFESLVCWYSPNLQGMTNKQLYDAMLIGEYPILRDLSGNGYDMELHGFDGTSASGVDGDGNLVFDGVNDWGESVTALEVDRDCCLIWRGYFVNKSGSERGLVACISSGGDTNSVKTIAKQIGTAVYYRYGSNQVGKVLTDGHHTIEFNGDELLVDYETSATFTQSINYQDRKLILSRWANGVYSEQINEDVICFSRKLTDDELTWVRNNMYVSQEPKKYTINFYYYRDGEPILLTSKKINNGSEIGELPSFDISATECTNEWYYDLTLSEDALVYEDDYVESDLNLYCSTMAK